jgi:hypothetical protein
MALRPPRDTADPESVAFGIAALDEHLDRAELSFPADAETVLQALDDPDVAYDASGHAMALSTALERADRERFGSERELLTALHPVFEQRRESASIGLVERLRSLL